MVELIEEIRQLHSPKKITSTLESFLADGQEQHGGKKSIDKHFRDRFLYVVNWGCSVGIH